MPLDAAPAPLAGGERSPYRDLAYAGIVVVAAFCLLRVLSPDARLHPDTAEDLLLARDCVELGACRTIGPPASVRGLFHGTLWIRLLAVISFLGGGAIASQMVIHALQALAVGALQLAVRRWVWAPAAPLAAGLFLATLVLSGDGAALTTVSPLPLPMVLATFCLLALIVDGRTRFAALAGVWLGVAIDCHPVVWLVLPTAVFLSATRAARPRIAAGVAVAAVLVTTAGSSWITWRYNLATTQHLERPLLFLGGVAAAALAGRLLRARLSRLDRRAAPWLLLGTLGVPIGLGHLWLLGFTQRGLQLRFVLPLAPALTTLAACAVLALARRAASRRGQSVGVRRRVVTGVAAFATVVVLLLTWGSALVARRVSTATGTGPWTFADLEQIGPRVRATGFRYHDLPLGLQGSACWELVAGLALHTPPPAAPVVPARRALMVLRTTAAAAAQLPTPGLERVTLRHGRVALLRTLRSWLDRRDIEVCYDGLDGGGRAPACKRLAPYPADSGDMDDFRFVRRGYPSVHDLRDDRPHLVRYSFGVAPTQGDRARTITVLDPARPGCSWGIESAPGRPATGGPPVRSVRLAMRVGDHGRLVLTKRFGAPECAGLAKQRPERDRAFRPCLLETRDGEDDLRAMAVHGVAP